MGVWVARQAHDTGIGNRVRAVRQRLGWSREALAFHAGISWSAISQLEGGRRRNLRPNTLAALAGALGVTIDYLVFGCSVSPAMVEHRALLYDNDADFLSKAVPFLHEGVDRSEAALAVTTEARCRLLREQLGAVESHVEFAEQGSWCAGPSAALSRLRTFVAGHLEAGSPWVRILVEPVVTGLSDAEGQSWARYESLLNIVFRYAPLTALCVYDVATLDRRFISGVLETHPHTVTDTGTAESPDYVDPIEFMLETGAIIRDTRTTKTEKNR
jgi:transcriptional regulator with XRE-family HTH domain